MDLEHYMRLALDEARISLAENEVPVGCVIADETGRVAAAGHNRCAQSRDPLRHAEMEAISAACRSLGRERLVGCTLFVTLEPCPMCAGAIMNSRISRLVYGAREELTGSCASVINLFEERYPSRPAIYGGILAAESAALMTEFFARLRGREGE
jgi:tRNA(adenine34) deaminase